MQEPLGDEIEIRDERTFPFTIIVNAVLDEYLPRIGSHAYTVYSLLARHADNSTRNCWPSIPRLADMSGISRRHVIVCLGVLERHRLVRVRRETGVANVYTLLDPIAWETDD